MYKDKSIAATVPAYNEQDLIGHVIEIMPDYVDLVVVVDDASHDKTSEIVQSYCEDASHKVILIRHETNQGVGGAILSGHRRAMAEGADIIAVMAGDAQMDPDDLPRLLDPIVAGRADYVKGNRFINGEAWRYMPKIRYFANATLSMLNKIVSGYWHISDPQCGYTVITRHALELLEFDKIDKRYFFENSLLVQLNVLGQRVVDVPVRAIYGVGESSGIRYGRTFLRFSLQLGRSFFKRLTEKYIIRDFHPLVLFYLFGLLLFPFGLIFGMYLFIFRLLGGVVAATSALFATFLTTFGIQFLLFAMLFDKDYKHPYQ
jgi:glycosyltransferase involved in cell wall biosynthesis